MSHQDQLQLEIDKELKSKGIKVNANIELEQDFTRLMNEISSDNLGLSDKFKEELEKIFAVFQVSMANEKIFYKLFKELKKESVDTYNKLQKVTEQQKEYNREIEILSQKLNNVQNEKQSIEKQKELLYKNEYLNNDKVKDDFSVEDNNIEKLEKEKELLGNKIELLTKSLTKVEEDKKNYYDLMIKYKSDIDISKQENINILDKQQKMNNQYESLKNKCDTAESNCITLREQLSKHEKENDELKKSKELLEKELKEIKDKITDLELLTKDLSDKKIRLEKERKKLLEDKENKDTDLKQAKSSIKELEENIKGLKKGADKLVMEKNSAILEFKSKENEVAKANKKYEKLALDLQEANGHINLLKNENDNINKEVDSEKNEKEKQSLLVKKFEKIEKDLLIDLKTKNEAIDLLTNEIKDKNLKCDKYNKKPNKTKSK